MSLIKSADRVKETSTTTGTGSYALGGAVAGFQAFSSALANSEICEYVAVDSSNSAFEYGFGTYTSSGNTLARTLVIASSKGSGQTMSWGSGQRTLSITHPRSRLTVRGCLYMKKDGDQTIAAESVAAITYTNSGRVYDTDQIFDQYLSTTRFVIPTGWQWVRCYMQHHTNPQAGSSIQRPHVRKNGTESFDGRPSFWAVQDSGSALLVTHSMKSAPFAVSGGDYLEHYHENLHTSSQPLEGASGSALTFFAVERLA